MADLAAQENGGNEQAVTTAIQRAQERALQADLANTGPAAPASTRHLLRQPPTGSPPPADPVPRPLCQSLAEAADAVHNAVAALLFLTLQARAPRCTWVRRLPLQVTPAAVLVCAGRRSPGASHPPCSPCGCADLRGRW